MQDPKTPAELQKRRLAANWLDIEVSGKKGDEKAAAAELRRLGTPESFIESALGAGSLPRMDTEGDATFILLRIFDESAEKRAIATHQLTRKISVIALPNEVITVHRFSCDLFPFAAAADPATPKTPDVIFWLIFNWALQTYTSAIGRCEEQFDELEAAAFNLPGGRVFKIKEAYFLKRRLSTHKRMLELTRDALESAADKPAFATFTRSPLRRRIQRAIGAADAFLEGMNQLLQLHLALVSQKTNEAGQRTNDVMRVLTVFSAFFLPLSFIAGVWGMNFEGMPELRHPFGYAGALALMGAVALGIFLWFRKRGWIGKSQH